MRISYVWNTHFSQKYMGMYRKKYSILFIYKIMKNTKPYFFVAMLLSYRNRQDCGTLDKATQHCSRRARDYLSLLGINSFLRIRRILGRTIEIMKRMVDVLCKLLSFLVLPNPAGVWRIVYMRNCLNLWNCKTVNIHCPYSIVHS